MAATIKQVAERAKVSIATVSYVLNGTGVVTEATRQRVLDAVSALDYQPSYAARSMRGRSQTLGLALPAQPGRLADPATAEILSGISEAAATRGYSLLLAAEDPALSEAELHFNMVRTGRVDGVILLDLRTEDERAAMLSKAGLPHVCAGPIAPESSSPFVAIDGSDAAGQAVRHLLRVGHRRIGLIQLPSELADSEPRYLGYAEALTAAGIAIDPELIVEGGRQEDDGYLAMQELLSLPEPPSAVLACSDELAFGAMHALYDIGKQVGKDVSIVGFDDVPLAAHTNPGLTALHQPRRELGEQLATLLIDQIQGKRSPQSGVTLRARLVIRQSSGPPVY